MKNFNELGLVKPVLRAVSAEGYETPTPIQAEVIPAMLEGKDVIGIAQTGTGKTAAFVLPILHQIVAQEVRAETKTCFALILAPTRELASQIVDSIRTYGSGVRHRVALVVGGAKPGPQIKAIARGVDIIVATPGRLEDHMDAGKLHLNSTAMIVLDEGDQMLDLGFMPAIRRIMDKMPKDRQTMLLSATMPKQVRKLAKDFLTDPAEISVAPESKPIERIDQRVVHVERSQKRKVLVNLLNGEEIDRAMIFTRTKRGADKVNDHLRKAGFSVNAIHGDKSQSQRVRTLAQFRKGSVNVLVATDIAARGIDVDGVSHVFNYDLPNVSEAYVHRIGRTARAGASGIAISLCDETERAYLRSIERLTKTTLNPMREVEGSAPIVDWTPEDDAVDAKKKSRGNNPRRKKSTHRKGNGPNTNNSSKKRSGDKSETPHQRSQRSEQQKQGQEKRQGQKQGQHQGQAKPKSAGPKQHRRRKAA